MFSDKMTHKPEQNSFESIPNEDDYDTKQNLFQRRAENTQGILPLSHIGNKFYYRLQDIRKLLVDNYITADLTEKFRARFGIPTSRKKVQIRIYAIHNKSGYASPPSRSPLKHPPLTGQTC